ncbi:MAG: flagellar hook protein FlgE, partial [Gammaproteobacteria bacterium]
MLRSLCSGISGLRVNQTMLDVTGNNVANANTVGAKSSRAEFADVYANSLYGAGSASNGIGVTVGAVTQQFTQGDVSATNNPLDIAINGAGFFRMNQAGTVEYSRNGQFQLDKEGYIVNAQGGRLTGYPADRNGKVNVGVPTELRVQTGDIAPRATDAGSVTVNLDARAEPGAPFKLTDSSTYSGATSLGVFDSQGAEQTVAFYFSKLPEENKWGVYGAVNGKAVGDGDPADPLCTVTFGPDGRLDEASKGLMPVKVPIQQPGGATQQVPVDLSKMTQFGSPFAVSELSQTGYAAGR